VAALRERAGRCLDHRLRAADEELRHTLARLRALSPAATLNRGYAIVQRPDGHVVRAASEVAAGERVRVRLASGAVRATVDATEEEDG
jgi:exodeoxyribonuclease VII large subunit